MVANLHIVTSFQVFNTIMVIVERSIVEQMQAAIDVAQVVHVQWIIVVQ